MKFTALEARQIKQFYATLWNLYASTKIIFPSDNLANKEEKIIRIHNFSANWSTII